MGKISKLSGGKLSAPGTRRDYTDNPAGICPTRHYAVFVRQAESRRKTVI